LYQRKILVDQSDLKKRKATIMHEEEFNKEWQKNHGGGTKKVQTLFL